ncbi:chemotaxis protein CheY [Pseudomonas atacamensis]|uniref:chemotaxis protein CheY n=1 Tax=Pseudomonas atacamensis TaxID=2565368 RepID=UPI000F018AE5|nr:chemotaxis protein CheY [Pseudomonas atacamensis]UVK95465.1 chemotaxis protein CheY [Pseudomonas atacamensis]UVL16026.1 chemotaxis protein CheY [Pseudomonas atacamensis]
MSNKALRILIADPQHFHRMKIERLFNALGYYRVAPVQTLGELLTLVDYGCEPFDVLVINAELAAGSLDLLGFLLDNPQVRHALIYNEPSAPLQAAAGFAQENAQISPTPLPNSQLIGQVMARVEACDERQAPPDSHASLRHANA